MKLTIQALNSRGEQAIRQHMIERSELSKFNPQKILYDKLFEELLVSEDPFVLQIRIRNIGLSSAMKFKDFKTRIDEAMLKNDAKPRDYVIKKVV